MSARKKSWLDLGWPRKAVAEIMPDIALRARQEARPSVRLAFVNPNVGLFGVEAVAAAWMRAKR